MLWQVRCDVVLGIGFYQGKTKHQPEAIQKLDFKTLNFEELRMALYIFNLPEKHVFCDMLACS